MHELSLCRSIYAIVERAAGDNRIGAIRLDVGALRQVVPQTLQYCWGIVVDETALAGSYLDITQIPAEISCEHCEQSTRLTGIPMMVCGTCGSGDIRVVAGDEFLLRSLDIAKDG